jgi:hypothetical protein
MAAALKIEIEKLVAKIDDKKESQKALEGLTEVISGNGRVAEPFVVTAFPKILEAFGDKSKAVKDAAVAASTALVEL